LPQFFDKFLKFFSKGVKFWELCLHIIFTQINWTYGLEVRTFFCKIGIGGVGRVWKQSLIGWRSNNSNSEIVLASELNLVTLFYLKNCKNCIERWILWVVFSRKCLDCPNNKSVHNSLTTSLSWMDQIFPCRQKWFLYKQKF